VYLLPLGLTGGGRSDKVSLQIFTGESNVQNISKFMWSIAVILGCIAGSASAEGDATAGKQKNALCQGCHGIKDFKMAYPKVYPVPKIGGQNVDYLVSALKAYRDGDRANETMHAIAADLSDQDIEDLAAYYSAVQ
jgi:cytochrome c553